MKELARAALLGAVYAVLVVAIVVIARGATTFVYQGF
jgi:hypothetical protein